MWAANIRLKDLGQISMRRNCVWDQFLLLPVQQGDGLAGAETWGQQEMKCGLIFWGVTPVEKDWTPRGSGGV